MARFEEPRGKPQGMFCLTAVLCDDRKEFYLVLIRSLFGSMNQNLQPKDHFDDHGRQNE